MSQLGSPPPFRGKGKTPLDDREFELILLIIELFFDVSLIFQCFDFSLKLYNL